MESILYFISGIALGSYLSRSWNTKGFKTLKKKAKARKKVTPRKPKKVSKKSANKDKVLQLLQENKKITNDDIEKMLKVSDATAERYLEELEKDKKVVQHGATGRSVFYTLK